MNPLLLIPSAAYRWLALAALLIVACGLCFYKGASFEQARQAKRELAAERAGVKLTAARVATSNKVDLKYAPALTQIRTVTKETIRYVPQFVRADDCPLPGGFRVLHDAAAQGRIPDAAGIPDAAAVPAAAAAETVASNYGACLENAKRLEGLQEWVSEQMKLNPPLRP